MLKWLFSLCKNNDSDIMLKEILLEEKEKENKTEIYSLTELLNQSKQEINNQKDKVHILRDEIAYRDKQINNVCSKYENCDHNNNNCVFKSTFILIKTLKKENSNLLESNNYLNQIYTNNINKYNNNIYNLQNKVNFLNDELSKYK